MSNKEKVIKLLNKNNGYFTTSDFLNLGLSKTTLKNYLNEGIVEKVCNGIYIDPKLLEDELYVIQLKYPFAVASYESALDILGLLNNIPSNINITIPRGKTVRANCEVHYVPENKYNVGITYAVNNFGNKIKIYNVERCICDMLRQDNDLEQQNRTLNYYFSSESKNIERLLEYAKIFNIYEKVNTIVEVMMKW